MENCYPSKLPVSTDRPPPLRAVVEIVGGELRIFPIANSDAEAAAILDALRFIREDFQR